MKVSSRRTAIRPLILALSLAASAASFAAQAAPIELNITSQPLSSALNELARQSGMVLLADAKLTGGRQSPALKGSYSLKDALRQLLNGSGLRADIQGKDTIIIKAVPASTGNTVSIGAVRVSGAAAGFLNDEQIEASERPYLKPGSSAHISRENIDRFRGTSPADIFKGTPGVVVSDARNSGAVDVNIRGLQGQGRVPVLIDGSMQATTIYRGYSGVADRSYIDPEMISEINITKGPSLDAQGTGAIGGLVSMTTLKPEDVLKPGERSGFRLRSGLQSNSAEARHKYEATPRSNRNSILDPRDGFISLAYALKEDDYDLVAAISHRQNGNYYSGKNGYNSYQAIDRWGQDNGLTKFYNAGDEVFNTMNIANSALLKGTYRFSEDQALELGYRYYKSNYGEIMPSQIWRSDSNVLHDFKASEVSTEAWTARYKYAPADNPLVNLKAGLWYTDMQTAARNGDVFSNPLEGKPHPGDGDCETCVEVVYLAKNQAQRYGADLSNTSRFETSLGPVQLNYGFSLQKENIAPSDSVKKTQEDFENNRTLRSGIRNEQSAFLNMQWQASDRLLLEAGGRYIHYSSKDRNVISTAVREKQGWQRIQMWDKDGNEIGSTIWRQDENGQFTDSTNPIKNGKGTLEPEKDGEEGLPVDVSKIDFWDTTGPVFYDKIPGAFTRTAPVERNGGGFAPAFSATYKLTDTISTYLRYTEGMRMPSMFESTVGFSARYASPLEPEHSKNWEAGISFVKDSVFTADDKLRLKIAYFNNNTENYITRRSFDGVSGMQNFTMHNLDSYSISGFELQSSYDRGDFFGELAATLNQKSTICDSKMAAYFRAKGKDWPEARETPDCSPVGFNTSYVSNMIPPGMMANGTLGTRQLDQKLTLGLRASYVSGPLNVTEDKLWTNYSGTSVQIKTLPYTLVDLFASYKINADTRVDMTIDNATDRYYLDPLTLSLMPGPGRTVRMSFAVKF